MNINAAGSRPGFVRRAIIPAAFVAALSLSPAAFGQCPGGGPRGGGPGGGGPGGGPPRATAAGGGTLVNQGASVAQLQQLAARAQQQARFARQRAKAFPPPRSFGAGTASASFERVLPRPPREQNYLLASQRRRESYLRMRRERSEGTLPVLTARLDE